jgi:16S rRNA (guanine527-N7)-methyltransferase
VIQAGFETHVTSGAKQAGIFLSVPQLLDLERYYELLRRWNRVINLTSLPLESYPPQTLDRLIVEPFFAARYLSARPCSCVDLGSGGGSPAIPMKVACPDIQMRMVESRERKVAFLREVIRVLGLRNAEVLNMRIAALPPELAGTVDVVTVRAVRPDQELLSVAATLLRRGGQLLLFESSGRTGNQSVAAKGLELSERIALPSGHSIAVLLRGD